MSICGCPELYQLNLHDRTTTITRLPDLRAGLRHAVDVGGAPGSAPRSRRTGLHPGAWPDSLVRGAGPGRVVVSHARPDRGTNRSAPYSTQPRGGAAVLRAPARRTGPGAQRIDFLDARYDRLSARSHCGGAARDLHGNVFFRRSLLPPSRADGSLRADHCFYPAKLDLVRHRGNPEDRVPVHRLLCRAATAGHQRHRGRADRRFWMWR